ncbi:MAG: hypothetical protein GY701_33705 [Sulfitobacter sp.]|nr:hypothetical protein [Sulfitobacter sp.]
MTVSGCSSTVTTTSSATLTSTKPQTTSTTSDPTTDTTTTEQAAVDTQPTGLAALRDSNAMTDRAAWSQVSTEWQHDPTFDLAKIRDLANAVVIGRITNVGVDRVVPGPATNYDDEFLIQHVLRFRLEVNEVISGVVAGSDPSVVNLEVIHWAPAGELELTVPRSDVLAYVTWSELVPEVWEPVERQYGTEFVANYRAARAEAHHLSHPGALLQMVDGQLEAPLLEAGLVRADRTSEPGGPLLDPDNDHSLPADHVRAEIAATTIDELHRSITQGPNPDLDAVRANVEARHLLST